MDWGDGDDDLLPHLPHHHHQVGEDTFHQTVGNLNAVLVWMYWCERGSRSSIGMEGESRSRSVSRNLSTSMRGCPSVSATRSMRVSGSVRETGGEMVVGVGWIDHVKLTQEVVKR